ncbi:hypothetical protein KL918_002884 [Ogataea parapolymorpha]|nr:hypothetical protein KL918_002884 [Ogataea parapolymorpha]KAG7871831.1 hypothetical protein KL916_003681 [Ogataea parapolymorpha]
MYNLPHTLCTQPRFRPDLPVPAPLPNSSKQALRRPYLPAPAPLKTAARARITPSSPAVAAIAKILSQLRGRRTLTDHRAPAHIRSDRCHVRPAGSHQPQAQISTVARQLSAGGCRLGAAARQDIRVPSGISQMANN